MAAIGGSNRIALDTVLGAVLSNIAVGGLSRFGNQVPYLRVSTSTVPCDVISLQRPARNASVAAGMNGTRLPVACRSRSNMSTEIGRIMRLKTSVCYARTATR
jgi:hypothetical protein